MLRAFLDRMQEKIQKHPFLKNLSPFFGAADTFLYETPQKTVHAPHIRDSVDLKRWMMLVVIALTPCIIMAIWNSGLQEFVYTSKDFSLLNEYLLASSSLGSYFDFIAKDNRYLQILQLGLASFLPVVFVSYAVGGAIEAIFACLRRHEIAEGFLVTGILFPLVLPPSIPLWMVAFGVAAGIILSKELFGGTGMNIFNPALVCRCLLFFAFPSRMSGDIWIGTNLAKVTESLKIMNDRAALGDLDGYSQTSPLSIMNISPEISRIHVDAIGSHTLGKSVENYDLIQMQFAKWKMANQEVAEWMHLSAAQLKSFLTSSLSSGGLGLASENFKAAYDFASLKFGLSHFTDGTLFFGNHMGSFGETSTLACLLGAFLLITFGIGSWRTMLGVALGAFVTAQAFNIGAHIIGPDHGAWNPAKFTLPAYKHLIMGGLAFGLVFMATDPVTAPGMRMARWLYGAFIGMLTVVIRIINPAYPEGVMLAILCANAFAPMIDRFAVQKYRRKKRVRSH